MRNIVFSFVLISLCLSCEPTIIEPSTDPVVVEPTIEEPIITPVVGGEIFNTVFEGGSTVEGVQVFSNRIPTIAEALNGNIVAVCESRLFDWVDRKTSCLTYRISKDGGQTWEDQKMLFNAPQYHLLNGEYNKIISPQVPYGEDGSNMSEHAVINPSMVVDSVTGNIFIVFSVYPMQSKLDVYNSSSPYINGDDNIYYDYPYETSCTVWIAKSTDNGESWNLENISDSIYQSINFHDGNRANRVHHQFRRYMNFGPGNGIEASDGNLIFYGRTNPIPTGKEIIDPLSVETRNRMSHSFLLVSQDHGESWLTTLSHRFDYETSLLEMENGDIFCSVRTGDNPRKAYVISGYDTWREYGSLESDSLELPRGGSDGCHGSLLKLDVNKYLYANCSQYSSYRAQFLVTKFDNMIFPTEYTDETQSLQIYDYATSYSAATLFANGEVGFLFEAYGADTIGPVQDAWNYFNHDLDEDYLDIKFIRTSID